MKNLFNVKRFTNYKIVLGLSYHRLGKREKNNPFHKLHTISLFKFKLQIYILQLFVKFVSLEDIKNFNLHWPINFFITFDDVSSSVLLIINWLERKQIPYCLCPCESITKNNFSWRDKVHCINRYADNNIINKKISEIFGKNGLEKLNELGFYKFTKSPLYNSSQMINEIVDPLFQLIKENANKEFTGKFYINRKDIEKVSRNKSSTIANHSKSHFEMRNLSYEHIQEEVEHSKRYLESIVNMKVDIFAIPFGEYDVKLELILNRIAMDLGINQIIWAEGKPLIIKQKNSYQIQHLPRIYVDENLAMFFLRLIKKIFKSSTNAFTKTKELKSTKNVYEIKNNIDIEQVFQIENIVSRGKDYSCAREFYDYRFTINPFQNGIPYNTAITKNKLPGCIGYNFCIPYVYNGKIIKNNLWSGWRNLNINKSLYITKQFFSALKFTDITTIWKPSVYIEDTFLNNKSFFKINYKSYKFKISKIKSNIDTEIFQEFNKKMSPLINKYNDSTKFSVLRSETLYRWRVDSYPLAKALYFLGRDSNGHYSTLIVVLYKEDKLQIVDAVFFDEGLLQECIKSIINYGAYHSFKELEFTSSYSINFNLKLTKHIEKVESFNSYIYKRNIKDDFNILSSKNNSEFNETLLAGDVFIK